MKVLGVTGGIGSGKSTVCRLLEKRSARIFNSDEIARHLMVADPAVRSRIERTFGARSYAEDGSLNRDYLAARVFSSDEDRETINGIVHPAVARAFGEAVKKALGDGVDLFVKEAALLFESGTDDLDYVVVVDAPMAVRLDRVARRDRAAEEDIQARMRGQLVPSEMRDRADFVIDNSGSVDDLAVAVEDLIRNIE